jgi:crotonobetainyl-CoA:carnitine CoA-transferase CaiB-like acyl-CoA transferase
VGYSGQPTSGLFTASDGRCISLGVVQQSQFETLARELDREQWLREPRFATPDLRRKHSEAMHEELASIFAQAPAEVWERRLSAAGLPCGMVRDVAEAVALPALDERQVKLKLEIPGLAHRSDVAIVNAGFLMSEDGPGVDGPPPTLGEHTHEVLAQLGFSAEERQRILRSTQSA